MNFKSFVLNRTVWMIVCYFVLFVAMSGMVYNVLNNTPWAGKDKKGNLKYISKGGRYQYVSEGLLMGFARNYRRF